MSGMRPTFVAFSMLPTAIIEFVQAKNPTLQKWGGKLQKTVCFENLLLAAFISDTWKVCKANSCVTDKTTNDKSGRHSVFALSRQLTSRVQLDSFGMQLLTDCLCKAIILDDESAAAKASTKAFCFFDLALLGQSFCTSW